MGGRLCLMFVAVFSLLFLLVSACGMKETPLTLTSTATTTATPTVTATSTSSATITATLTPGTTTTPTATTIPTAQWSAQSEGLAGDRILFVTFSEGSLASLYIVNADNSKLSKLVDVGDPGEKDWNGDALNWPALSLSPDKKYVAYFSPDGYLCILNIGDGKVTKLKEAGQEKGDRYVAWSPDGSRIAHVCGGSLYVIDADGTDCKKLASPESGYYLPGGAISDQIRRPVWSADGKRVLFDDFYAPSSMYGKDASATIYRAVYAIDIDSGSSRKLFDRGRVGSPTSYGSKMVVCGYTEEVRIAWFVMNDDGTSRKLIPNTVSTVSSLFVLHLRWSPDGNAIAYIGSSGSALSRLMVVDAATGGDIAPDAKFEVEGLEACSPVWSPDSQYISYVCSERGNVKEIHIVRRDLSGGFLVYRLSSPNQNAALVAWLR